MGVEYRIMLLTDIERWEEVEVRSDRTLLVMPPMYVKGRVQVSVDPPLKSVEDCQRAIDEIVRTSSLEPGAFRIEQRTITDWQEIDLVPDCPHYFPHTRAWCGTPGCPE